ncbi:K(+)/H(+) antiporter NhaP2 [Thalassoglobus neptunius]|uniref:K(+)/H(+) antiporter NhaP2 n=1 Tax=Thalassoglobus neptunius TaxID=1938619 RepID=A0A5C5WH42_9PLAN|nr:sodium:proton antiporter [Thalassoglobus neptunius]TWT50098.1 K(+)/H(+) antiporter NhaP2 [Thalassoglobus neptunius]
MHETDLLISLTLVVVFGTGAQWLSWKLRLPSILLLLASGFIAGPVLNVVDPDKLLGDLLFPFVSISVAVILFEGSLSLKLPELKQIGAALGYILSVGVFVTWGLIAIGAYYILEFSVFASILLGAILVVTGPTVIGPLLRQIRPIGQVGPIARWEGIVIDPIGAVLAVLVFEAYAPLLSEGVNQSSIVALQNLLSTILYGGGIGAAAAIVLAWVLKNHAVPDHLESLVTLLFVLTAFTASNLCQEESGLVAVTLMGVMLANSGVTLKHILEFKESLSLLLISGLFILLAARVELSSIVQLGWRGQAFVAFVILVVRPVAIFISTAFSQLNWKERLFLSWMAPRGIVAAAVSSVFAFKLSEYGTEGEQFVSATFMVIVGTVVVYGLTAFPLARKLGLASSNPQGVLLLGANELARAIGGAIQEAGIVVLLVDTNRWNIATARMEGLRTSSVNILDENAAHSLDLGGIGRFLALTPNDEVNSLGAMHFAELFGRANVFQLTPWRRAEKQERSVSHLRARFLFGEDYSYQTLVNRLDSGAVIKTTKLTTEFTFDDFQNAYGGDVIPLFTIQNGKLAILDSTSPEPKVGQKLIAIVDPQPASTSPTPPPTEEADA